MSKDNKKKQARKLYESPDNSLYTLEDVADHLDCSVSCIKKYAAEDSRNGHKWKKVPRLRNSKKQNDNSFEKDVLKGNHRQPASSNHSDGKVTVRKTYVDGEAVKDILGFNPLDETFKAPDLTDREKMFCYFFLETFSVKNAAVKAGYAPKNAAIMGARVMSRPAVTAEINRLKEIIAHNCFVSIDRIINKHASIAFSDLSDYVDYGHKSELVEVYDEDGNVVDYEEKKVGYFNIKPLAEVDGSIIKEVKQGKYGMEIKLEDRQKSLDFLANFIAVPKKIDQDKLDIVKAKLNLDKETTLEEMLEMVRNLSDDGMEEFINGLQE